jgi:predicted nucleotide-binding protein
VGQLLWYRDRKKKTFVIEGSDEAARLHLEEKERAAAADTQHVEAAPVTVR